jgi:hypothetical protein
MPPKPVFPCSLSTLPCGKYVDVRVVGFPGASFEGSRERFGEGGFDPGGRKDSLGLAERDPEGIRQYAQGSEILLELGDTYREGLCTGIEGREASL